MRFLYKKALAASVAVSIFAGAAWAMGAKAQKEVKSEEELGLRKQTIYNEEPVTPPEFKYSEAAPGTSKKIPRAYQNCPPMIPHDTAGMTPITQETNACLTCHMPDVAPSVGATAIPKSHFTNYRTEEHKFLGELYKGRFNCTQCHAPQAQIDPLVKNNFQGGFKVQNGEFSSNLSDSINEGVEAQ